MFSDKSRKHSVSSSLFLFLLQSYVTVSMHFWFLGHHIFLILYCCYWKQVRNLKTWIFIYLALLERTKDMFSLELIIPHNWGKILLSISFWNWSVLLLGTGTIYSLVEMPRTTMSNPFSVILSQALSSFLMCICWSVLTWILQFFLVSILYAALSSVMFWLVNSSHLASLDSQLYLLNLGSLLRSTWVLPLCHSLETLQKTT